jgi:Flp pilus assembly protein TadG
MLDRFKVIAKSFVRRLEVMCFMSWQPRHGESGQALVEMAILSPVFVLLFIGAVDFGRFTYDGIILANAARAAVQYGVQTVTTINAPAGSVQETTIKAAAAAEAQGLTPAVVTTVLPLICTCADGSPPGADCLTNGNACAASHRLVFLSVTVTDAFTPIIAYPGVSTNALRITRTAEMQMSPS